MSDLYSLRASNSTDEELVSEDIDDLSDVGDIPSRNVPRHVESTVEADVEANDQLQDDIANDVGKVKGTKAKREEQERVTEDEDDDEDEELFEVEAIVGHEWRLPKGKRKGTKVLLYIVKWKGWPDSDNTLEPEENLTTSRDLLAAYHHKIGGAPQPESETQLTKKRSTKSLREEESNHADSLAEDSPAPSAKRQKRSPPPSRISNKTNPEWGGWVPNSKSWENDIREIQTVERDHATNDLYILIVFNNGRKSKVKREVVHKKCPLKMLEFYENHLNFAVNEHPAYNGSDFDSANSGVGFGDRMEF